MAIFKQTNPLELEGEVMFHAEQLNPRKFLKPQQEHIEDEALFFSNILP